MLPAHKLPAVETALQQTFGTPAIEAIELMTRGLSPALVYKIRVNGKDYILRLVMAINELADPAREYVCLHAAADAGIAPAVLYADAAAAISICAYIAGPPIWVGLPDKDIQLKSIAEKVKAIHALPLFPPLINFLEGVIVFRDRFLEMKMFPESATAEHFSYFDKIKAIYPINDELVSSHNDLNPANILYDGEKIWMIDWEAGFKNDRYVDLAVVALYFAANEQHIDTFLTAYFGAAPTALQKAKFYLMRQVVFLYYGTIFLRMAAEMKDVHDQDMKVPTLLDVKKMMSKNEVNLGSYEGKILYGKMLMQEALTEMQQPAFEASLALLN
ncbi:Choline/ethanolamine kinase [Chitinophaga sancti]|nr:Choline/ethanolamine kinase [Chitinophaga sancti]